MTGLNAGRHTQLGVRPDDRTKNQPLPGRLFKARFRFLDRGIFFQSGLENAPRALKRLFLGENTGKQLVRIAD